MIALSLSLSPLPLLLCFSSSHSTPSLLVSLQQNSSYHIMLSRWLACTGPISSFHLSGSGSCPSVSNHKAIFCEEDRTLWHKTFNANHSTGEPTVKINRQDRHQGDVFYVCGGGDFLHANPQHQVLLFPLSSPRFSFFLCLSLLFSLLFSSSFLRTGIPRYSSGIVSMV